jgi:methylmalonyl-CoA mutase C-terminal domain/subunit
LALVPRIREVMNQSGLDDVPLLVGGIIPEDDKPKLQELGVSGIFGPGTNTEDIAVFIRQLVEAKSGTHG